MKNETKTEVKTETADFSGFNMMTAFTEFAVNDFSKYEPKIRERATKRVESEFGDETKKVQEEKLKELMREETKILFCKLTYANLTGPQFNNPRYWMDKFVDFGVNVTSLAFVVGAAAYVAKRSSTSTSTEADSNQTASDESNPFADANVSSFKSSKEPAQRRASH